MSDGNPQITAMLKREFPAPLSMLLVTLYDRNRDYWLCPARSRTVGAAAVRKQGLTSPQWDWAMAVREQMDGPHELWADGVEPEEIVSDTTAEDLFGGDLR